MGKKVKQPPPPNYEAAAQAQGEANVDAARVGAALNRVDQYTPYGNVTYENLGGDRWAQYTDFSPEQQEIFDLTQSAERGLAGLAGDQLGRVTDALGRPLDTGNLPARASTLPSSNYRTSVNAPDLERFNAPALQGQDYQSSVDFSGAPAMPGDLEAQRQEVIDTVYGMSSRQLDPQFSEGEEALRSRLLNSGIAQGSEAYDREMNDFYRRKEAAYGDARDRAILLGGQEQSRLFGDTLAARNQMVGEALQGGTFANTAAEMANRYGLSAREMALGENAYNNEVEQQGFRNDLTEAGFSNDAQARMFAEALTRANLTNQNRDAQLQEDVFLRQLPFNELTALLSGSQVQYPQPGGVPQAAAPGAAPVFDAAMGQANDAMSRYAQQQAGSNATTQGLFNLGSTAVTAAALF